MSEIERKTKAIYVASLGSELEGTPEKVIETIQRYTRMKEEDDLRIEFRWKAGDYEDYYTLHVYRIRPETEEEAQERTDREKRDAERTRDWELAQLKLLKEKYGETT
jgi:hypothetical protein